MQPRLSIIVAALALAACSSPEEVADKTGVSHAAAAAATSTASSAADARKTSSGAARSVKEDNDLYSYAFSYPAQVGAHPELAQRLEADADRQKAELVAEAKDARADAGANGYPYNPHSWLMEWKVVADTPGFLSLTGDVATYGGGAHGMYDTRSLVWDKAAKARLAGVELFRSAGDLEAALGPKLCKALDAQRREKRGPDWKPARGAEQSYGFDDCQHVKDATVIVGSSNGNTFDRIGIWFGPYVAGPYAEGAYELDFPVDAAVLGAVKPAYRSAFSTGR